jgi:hypothetical protein
MKFTFFKVYGLGAAFEIRGVCHDEEWRTRLAIVGKVFLGPLLVNLTIPIGPWRAAEPPF